MLLHFFVDLLLNSEWRFFFILFVTQNTTSGHWVQFRTGRTLHRNHVFSLMEYVIESYNECSYLWSAHTTNCNWSAKESSATIAEKKKFLKKCFKKLSNKLYYFQRHRTMFHCNDGEKKWHLVRMYQAPTLKVSFRIVLSNILYYDLFFALLIHCTQYTRASWSSLHIIHCYLSKTSNAHC